MMAVTIAPMAGLITQATIRITNISTAFTSQMTVRLITRSMESSVRFDKLFHAISPQEAGAFHPQAACGLDAHAMRAGCFAFLPGVGDKPITIPPRRRSQAQGSAYQVSAMTPPQKADTPGPSHQDHGKDVQPVANDERNNDHQHNEA